MDTNKANSNHETRNRTPERLHLHTCELLQGKDESMLDAFCRGVQDGAFRQPLKAIQQLAGCGHEEISANSLPPLEIQSDSSSHRLGEIISSFVPFAVVGAITKRASKTLLGEAANPTLFRVMSEHAGTGFIMGSLLNTSNLKPGESLLGTRLSQGLSSAVTFASLSGSAGFLENALPQAKTFGLLATRKIGIAASSGALGGVVDAELKSQFTAKKEDLVISAAGFAGFGMLMEASGLAIRPGSLQFSKPIENSLPLMRFKFSETDSKYSMADRQPESNDAIKSKTPAQENLEPQHVHEHKPESDAGFSIAKLDKSTMPFSREQLLREFKSIGFKDANGSQTDLYTALMNCQDLSDVQKVRLIDTACQIRNHYVGLKQSTGMSNKASLSWLYHQAALAEVFLDLSEMKNLGQTPEPRTLENDCLLSLFSQFRTHDKNIISPEMIRNERAKALHQILSDVYPQSHIKHLKEELYEMPASAHPADLISYDNELLNSLSAAKTPERFSRQELDPTKVAHSIELNRLSERFSQVFSSRQDRLSRIDRLLSDFVTSSRVPTEKKALFYQQLNRLLRENDKARLRLEQRIDLAEQVLNHAYDLSSIDQGANKTCNVTTVENRIYARQPQEMARMIADLAETGIYISNSGHAINLSRSLTGLKPDAEARASLKMQADGTRDVKRDGARDWASQLAQTTMIKLFHERDGKLIAGDVIISDSKLAYNQKGQLLGLVDKTDLEEFVDEKGKSINQIKKDTKLFRKDGAYVQEVDPRNVVYDERGNPCSFISDQNKILRLYDQTAKPIANLTPGTLCFNSQGDFALYNSNAGEVTYDKILGKPRVEFRPDSAEELERMHFMHFGKRTFLKEINRDQKVEKINSPCLGSRTYRHICHEITGSEKSAFSIMRDSPAGEYYSTVYVDNIDEFEKTLLKFQAENNLPAIIVVNTRQSPEKDNPFSSKNPDAEGGSHVVNVHSYDPVTKLLRITNQWGSRYDYMDTGVELEKVYKSMHF